MTGEIEGTAAVLEFDVEGHAFSLHFPTAKDADAFKRGVLTGALAATLVVGGAAGAATLASQGHAVAVPVAVTTPLAQAQAIPVSDMADRNADQQATQLQQAQAIPVSDAADRNPAGMDNQAAPVAPPVDRNHGTTGPGKD